MAPSGTKVALVVAILAVASVIAINWFSTDDEGTSITYTKKDFFHESAIWDAENNRFLLTAFNGGIFEVRMNDSGAGVILRADELVEAPKEVGSPSWAGLRLDPSRRRVLVVHSRLNLNYSGLSAYDSQSWELLFSTQLAGPESLSLADDVAIDEEGNAYVTDAASSLIWKVSTDGSQVSVFTDSPVFKVSSPIPFGQVSLNGILLHPDGYFLVDHTWAGAIFRVSLDGTSVHRVNLTGSTLLADGISLVSPHKLAIATVFGTKLVETSDGWETARVTHNYYGPLHRLGTAVVVKDGRVFTSYGLGFGIRQKHGILREAIFKPV